MKWIETRKVVPEIEYNCGKWHMDSNNPDGDIYLFNYDLSYVPCGYAPTEQEAFEDMLQKIGEYEQKLKQVRSEIQEHLAELKGEKHD